MKALVTGGAGFIGSHLVDALLVDGWEVRIVDNLTTGTLENLNPDAEFIYGNIRKTGIFSRAMCGIDVVFHQAAIPAVPRSIQMPVSTNSVNVGGTLDVLEAARAAGVRRVVFASSSSVYGDTDQLPKIENMAIEPLSPYAVQKLACEGYCKVYNKIYGLETVALRYFNVFGPRQDPTSDYAAVIPLFITHALRDTEPTIEGDGCNTRDFTYVANVVHANLLAAESEEAVGRVINVGTGTQTSINTLWKTIKKLTGTDVDPVPGPPRQGDVRDSLAGQQVARSLLGYYPSIRVKEGLELTIGDLNEA
jgi:nucleoside-diphosphate-sugar epimerase